MSLEDDLIRHQIFVERYGRHLAKLYKKYIQTATNKAIKSLRVQQNIISDLQIKQDLLKTLQRGKKALLAELQKFVNYEQQFIAKILKNSLNLSIEQQKLLAEDILIKTSLGGQTNKISNVYNTFNIKKIQQYSEVINNGAEKEGRGERLQEMNEGLFNTQNLVLAGLAVGAAQHLVARKTVQQNPQIKIRWSSVLESTTCPVCADLHGQVFTEEDLPSYPQHGRCQCSLIYEIQ